MSDDTPITEWTPEQLFEQFRNDMLYDSHQTYTRILRSDAAQEIIQRGRDILEAIADYLTGVNYLSKEWHILLQEIGKTHRINLDWCWSLGNWIAWCREHATPA